MIPPEPTMQYTALVALYLLSWFFGMYLLWYLSPWWYGREI